MDKTLHSCTLNLMARCGSGCPPPRATAWGARTAARQACAAATLASAWAALQAGAPAVGGPTRKSARGRERELRIGVSRWWIESLQCRHVSHTMGGAQFDSLLASRALLSVSLRHWPPPTPPWLPSASSSMPSRQTYHLRQIPAPTHTHAHTTHSHSTAIGRGEGEGGGGGLP